MFKKYLNHKEANYLVNLFSKLFNFVEFNEVYNEFVGISGEVNSFITTYTAKTDDNWEFEIKFYSNNSKVEKRMYYPMFKFNQIKKDIDNHKERYEERRKKIIEIADFMQNTYRPEFERMINVLRIFVGKGIEYGMFNSFEEKRYKKVIKSHIKSDHYRRNINLSDNNFGTVTFNNILQKGYNRYDGLHFKKSYMSVSIDYLAHSDSSIHPYFKIRLPYSDSRKSTCVIPLSGESIVYFMPNDSKLQEYCIDTLPSTVMEESTLKEFFDKEFHEEIKTSISKALKMDKSQLEGSTKEDLKGYFSIVEMLKI